MASVYESMTNAKKKVADCLQELGLWWWDEFPVFVYDEKERPRVWTSDFYIPKLGMYIEVCGMNREGCDNREKIFMKNGYNIVFLHLFKKENMWKKYLVERIMEIEDHRHSEIEKMVGQLINRLEPVNIEESRIDENNISDSQDEIKKIYPRAYEKWTSNEDQQLTIEYKQAKSIPQIAVIHQRKTIAIRSRLTKLGLISDIGKAVL
jgi:hypothetical protein